MLPTLVDSWLLSLARTTVECQTLTVPPLLIAGAPLSRKLWPFSMPPPLVARLSATVLLTTYRVPPVRFMIAPPTDASFSWIEVRRMISVLSLSTAPPSVNGTADPSGRALLSLMATSSRRRSPWL